MGERLSGFGANVEHSEPKKSPFRQSLHDRTRQTRIFLLITATGNGFAVRLPSFQSQI
jgi:hypothetical protein